MTMERKENELEHCKNCWDAFVNMCKQSGAGETIKQAEMMVKTFGAMATYQLCGFEDKELPEQVKQIIADGLMYLEISCAESSNKN